MGEGSQDGEDIRAPGAHPDRPLSIPTGGEVDTDSCIRAIDRPAGRGEPSSQSFRASRMLVEIPCFCF
jgi:hypothetical protein